MSSDCLFCKIVSGDIPANILYENDHVLAFRDINPQAPFHALIIPKKHIATLNQLEVEAGDHLIIGELYLAAKQLATQEGFAEEGYRTVMNCGEKGGQTVYHIHLHVLAGRSLTWPPG
ncbi:MAG: histidine triad nucleotide-binding protein [bacterium]